MSKVHYFRKRSSKIAKCWGSPVSTPSRPKPPMLVTRSCMIWKNCGLLYTVLIC